LPSPRSLIPRHGTHHSCGPRRWAPPLSLKNQRTGRAPGPGQKAPQGSNRCYTSWPVHVAGSGRSKERGREKSVLEVTDASKSSGACETRGACEDNRFVSLTASMRRYEVTRLAQYKNAKVSFPPSPGFRSPCCALRCDELRTCVCMRVKKASRAVGSMRCTCSEPSGS